MWAGPSQGRPSSDAQSARRVRKSTDSLAPLLQIEPDLPDRHHAVPAKSDPDRAPAWSEASLIRSPRSHILTATLARVATIGSNPPEGRNRLHTLVDVVAGAHAECTSVPANRGFDLSNRTAYRPVLAHFSGVRLAVPAHVAGPPGFGLASLDRSASRAFREDRARSWTSSGTGTAARLLQQMDFGTVSSERAVKEEHHGQPRDR